MSNNDDDIEYVDSKYPAIAKVLKNDQDKEEFKKSIDRLNDDFRNDKQRLRLVKQVLLGLFYSGNKEDFDRIAVDIFIECILNGQKFLKELDYPGFIRSFKYLFREVYDIKRGLLDIALADAGSKREEYVDATYLGYKLLFCINSDPDKLSTDSEEKATPMGSPLIVKYEAGRTMYLLVYPENVGCYTFLGWDFNDSEHPNPDDLIEKITSVVFNGDRTKIGGKLNPELDCILPASLDSTRAMHVYRIDFSDSVNKHIIEKSQKLKESSMAKCNDYCYATLENMLDRNWKPNPYKYPSIYCGEKVRIFALLRKLESEFIKSGKDPKSIAEVIRRYSADELTIIKKVLKEKNSYHDRIKEELFNLTDKSSS